MSNLGDVQAIVQQTAEAIAEVLKIEVEVADATLVRIAGTGQYREQLGIPMQGSFVYQHVLRTGETVVIDNPGFHELCRPCSRQGDCFESAEMATPILLDDHPVGVIGLICFDREQALRLLANKEWLIHFIVKMSELITATLPQPTRHPRAGDTSLKLINLEKEAIIQALAKTGNDTKSKELAAKLLGISRATLYRKIKEYEISV